MKERKKLLNSLNNEITQLRRPVTQKYGEEGKGDMTKINIEAGKKSGVVEREITIKSSEKD